MNDCIERKKAIELIQPHVKPQTVYGEGYLRAIQHATDILELMPAADVQPVDRWTSIEESKPEDMQQVLAVVDGDVREAFYNAGCFIGSNFYRSINEVKWWQPLPEPPKGGDTNE